MPINVNIVYENLKFFLEASVEERAKRIVGRSSSSSGQYKYEESLKILKIRDNACDERFHVARGALASEDAIKIDTTFLDERQVMNVVLKHIDYYLTSHSIVHN